MSRLFDQAVQWLLTQEGGWGDDPRDPGGATNFGISLRFALQVGDLDHDGHPDLDIDGDGQITPSDIRALPREQAIQLYQSQFWALVRADELPWRLAPAVFDAAVNMGRGPAVTLLQHTLGVPGDGHLGPVTLAAARTAAADPVAVNDLLLDYLARRAVRYSQLQTFAHFGYGWMRRLFALHRFCLRLSG